MAAIVLFSSSNLFFFIKTCVKIILCMVDVLFNWLQLAYILHSAIYRRQTYSRLPSRVKAALNSIIFSFFAFTIQLWFFFALKYF